jgi:hypothetical protein
MITGQYIFYENGKEILRSPNVITKFGKRFFTNLLAGNINNISKDIAIGIDQSDATELDTRLGFEFYKAPIILGSNNIQSSSDGTSSYSIIFKTVIPQDVQGHINEIGLYPSIGSSILNIDTQFITEFNSYLDWIDESGFNADSSVSETRIGNNILIMQASSELSNEYIYQIGTFDLSKYNRSDSLRLAYYKYDNNLESIKIRFYSSDTAYLEKEITPDPGVGHHLSSNILISDFLNGMTNPAPDISSIVKIGISIVPSGSDLTRVGMDGLRISDEDIFDPFYGIISRSVIKNYIDASSTEFDDVITVSSNNNIFLHQKVSGSGIVSNTEVIDINGNEITLSIPTSGPVGGEIIFYGINKISGRSLDLEYKIDLDWNV